MCLVLWYAYRYRLALPWKCSEWESNDKCDLGPLWHHRTEDRTSCLFLSPLEILRAFFSPFNFTNWIKITMQKLIFDWILIVCVGMCFSLLSLDWDWDTYTRKCVLTTFSAYISPDFDMYSYHNTVKHSRPCIQLDTLFIFIFCWDLTLAHTYSLGLSVRLEINKINYLVYKFGPEQRACSFAHYI